MSARILVAAAFVAAVAIAPDAHAMGAVLTSPPGASSPVSVRIAVAGASGRTARWGSVEVRGSATKFAWLLPARTGAFVDLASDAWLEALGAATAPRVVPPNVTPPCGIPGGDEVDGDFTHTVTAAPDAVAVAPDRASLDTVLAGWGLAVTSDVAPPLDAALASGSSVVALLYSTPSADVVTRTVRIVDDSPETIPLGLVAAGSSPLDVTAYAFVAGGAALTSATAVTMDPAAILWRNDGTSTYASARDALLASTPGSWLFETGGQQAIFDSATVPGGDIVPPLAITYFFRAASYADATDAPDTCAQSADSWQSSAATLAPACPAGALARVGQATCAETVGTGEIDPSVLRCGGTADDLALALSGLTPGSTWITRVRSALAPSSFGKDVPIVPSQSSAPYGPVVTASAYAETCPSSSGSGGGSSSGGSSGTGGSGGSGSGSSGGPAQDPGTDPGSDPGGASDVAAAAAASDIASAASDGCSGSSSDGSGDSCSGNTTSSSDGTDSSSGCSGSSSSSDSSSSSCDVSTRRHNPTSRLGLLLVALAALVRRRARTSAD
jgi:uncharacterized membrane protein YgcG